MLLYLWSVIPHKDSGIEERFLWLLPSLFPLKICSSSHTPLEKMPCDHASHKQPRKLYFANNWKINCLLTSKTAWHDFFFLKEKLCTRKNTSWVNGNFYDNIYKHIQKGKEHLKERSKYRTSFIFPWSPAKEWNRWSLNWYKQICYMRQSCSPGHNGTKGQSLGQIYNTGQHTHLYANWEAIKAPQLSHFSLIATSAYCP